MRAKHGGLLVVVSRCQQVEIFILIDDAIDEKKELEGEQAGLIISCVLFFFADNEGRFLFCRIVAAPDQVLHDGNTVRSFLTPRVGLPVCVQNHLLNMSLLFFLVPGLSTVVSRTYDRSRRGWWKGRAEAGRRGCSSRTTAPPQPRWPSRWASGE